MPRSMSPVNVIHLFQAIISSAMKFWDLRTGKSKAGVASVQPVMASRQSSGHPQQGQQVIQFVVPDWHLAWRIFPQLAIESIIVQHGVGLRGAAEFQANVNVYMYL